MKGTLEDIHSVDVHAQLNPPILYSTSSNGLINWETRKPPKRVLGADFTKFQNRSLAG